MGANYDPRKMWMLFIHAYGDADGYDAPIRPSLSAATPATQRLPRMYWLVENKAKVWRAIDDAPKDDEGRFSLRAGGPQRCSLIHPGDIVYDEHDAIHYDLFEAWVAMGGGERGQMVAEGRQIQRAWADAVRTAEGKAPFQNSENPKLRRDGTPRWNSYEKAGRFAKTSRDSVWKSKVIARSAPELIESMRAGTAGSLNQIWNRLKAEGRIQLKRPRKA